jgi:SAM-dependent methyltransferase
MGFPSSREELLASPLYNQYWYYNIELMPELLTKGAGHLNLGLTRKLLKGCEVQGRRCLDIGAMECAVPILLSRRKAEHVVGVDIASFDAKVDAVRHYTGAKFDYHSGLTHGNTLSFLKNKHDLNFDLVVLSGVLYHCFGPLHTLAMARSLVRTGGIMIVELFSVIDEQFGMFFNKGGMFTPDPSSYFLISVPLLDYVLRYFKLAPLDCVHGQHSTVGGRYKCARVAVVCRAQNDVLATAGDTWMSEATKIVDYLTLFDWSVVDKSAADPVTYQKTAAATVFRKDTGTCDLYETVLKSAPMDLVKQDSIIRLADLY